MQQGKRARWGKRAKHVELASRAYAFFGAALSDPRIHKCEWASVGGNALCIKTWRARACALRNISGIWLPHPSLLGLSPSADPCVSEGWKRRLFTLIPLKALFSPQDAWLQYSRRESPWDPPPEGSVLCFLCHCGKIALRKFKPKPPPFSLVERYSIQTIMCLFYYGLWVIPKWTYNEEVNLIKQILIFPFFQQKHARQMECTVWKGWTGTLIHLCWTF